MAGGFVGRLVSRACGYDCQRSDVGEGGQQRQARGGGPTRYVQYQGAQLVEQGVCPVDRGGCHVQVDLVDEPFGKAVPDEAVKPDYLVCLGTGGGHGFECGVIQLSQFAVDPHQGPFGRRMVCNGAEQVGRVCEGGAHGGAHNWVGDAAPLVVGQGRAGQQPGQAEQGLEAHRGQPDGSAHAGSGCQ